MHYCSIIFTQGFSNLFHKVILPSHRSSLSRDSSHDRWIILFLVSSVKLKCNKRSRNAEHSNQHRLRNPRTVQSEEAVADRDAQASRDSRDSDTRERGSATKNDNEGVENDYGTQKQNKANAQLKLPKYDESNDGQ